MAHLNKKDINENSFSVRPPRFLVFIGILFALLGVMIFVAIHPITEGWWIYFVSLGFLFSGSILLLLYSWRLNVKKAEFQTVSLIKGSKTFKFSDITSAKMNRINRNEHTALYAGEKKILTVGSDYQNYDAFIVRLKKEGIRFIEG